MFPDEFLTKDEAILMTAREKGFKIATAESCTGGLIAGCLTEIAGSSDVFERGFVTYSNEAKQELLGVSPALIEQHGAVSQEVAIAMADGALIKSRAHISVSVTGIAGPGGGTSNKPVGLVHFGLGHPCGTTLHEVREFGDIGRDQVRLKSLDLALDLLQMNL
jgi:nicotinamide-nucleotide amidase